MSGARIEVAEAAWSPRDGWLEPYGGAAAVLDERGELVELGPAEEVARRRGSLPVVRGPGVLMPGLVDCHAHLECAALAGLVSGGDGLGAWVSRLVKARMPMTHGDLEAAARRAAREMRALGTVAVADVCTLLATAPLLAEADLMGISLLEVVGANDEAVEAALADADRRAALPAPSPEVVAVPTPHSAYGTAPRGIVALAARGQGVRSIHAAEHEDESAWLLSGEGPFAPFLRSKGAEPPGMRPLSWLERLGAIGPATLLVHLVTASPEELARAAALGATAVLCPRSNRAIGGRLPDLHLVRASGIRWTLGTDSLASTPDHDLLAEAATLAEAFPEVPAEEILRAATVEGARALGLARHPWIRVARERLAFHPQARGGTA